MIMSVLRTTLAANTSKALRPLAAARSHVAYQARFMSVQILEGEDEVEKFRMVNSKSILYFTGNGFSFL